MDRDLPDRIYLTGFMGSGKTTIAPLLADAFGYHVHDLDDAIVARAKRAIPDIFADGGEEEFRRLERELLEETTVYEQAVISLGGGAVTFSSNLQFVREHGGLVYLKVPVEILVERLYGASGRPLLRDDEGNLLSRRELQEKIARMLRRREPYYERADLIVDAGSPAPEETAESIVTGLRRKS